MLARHDFCGVLIGIINTTLIYTPFVILLFSIIVQLSAKHNKNRKKQSGNVRLYNDLYPDKSQLTIIIDNHHTYVHAHIMKYTL